MRSSIAASTNSCGLSRLTFHWGPGKEDADNVRDLEIASAGWQLLYVTWTQLQDPDRFVELVTRTVRTRRIQLASTESTVGDRNG